VFILHGKLKLQLLIFPQNEWLHHRLFSIETSIPETVFGCVNAEVDAVDILHLGGNLSGKSSWSLPHPSI
jgi:hypothetical protein